MRVEVIAPSHLDAGLIDEWNALQQSNPALDSPFFCSAFTRAIGEERPGIEVAVVEDGNDVIGFLPYCRERRHVARPVAGSFTDFQGMVLAPEATIDPVAILRQCRLNSWQFDHLIADQPAFEPFHWARSESPYMDLSNGFEAYRIERRKTGSNELQEALRKSRKIERDVAPLRFEMSSTNYCVLETLVTWKQAQLRARRVPDCFRASWVTPALERLLHTHGENYQSMLAALYVGDDLLAVNFGLRSGPVLHGWITAFNAKYHKFSPGLILLTRLAQIAESHGITRIDMGRGDEAFKRSFGSGVRVLAEGAVDRRVIARSLQRNWVRAKELIRSTPLDAPARQLVAALRYAGSRVRHTSRAEDAA